MAEGVKNRGGNRGSYVGNCSCDNAYQDAKYGKGKRVMNNCNKGGRCTGCGANFL